jgi:tetratricopeptide (TPR) repeat protein
MKIFSCRCSREPARGIRKLVNTPWPRTVSRLQFVTLALCSLLTACSSTKPPAPVSELRQQARRDMDSGLASYEHRNWPSAAAAFERAAQKYAAMDDDAALASALVNQGNAIFQGGDSSTAKAIFEEAQSVADRAGAKLVSASALAGRAKCLMICCGPATAAPLLEQALTSASGDAATSATLQNELAVVLMHLNDAKAVELLQAALAANTSLGRNRDVAVNHLNLGRYYLRQGQHLELAKQDLDTALATFKKLDDPVGLSRTHESLAEYYAATGNADQAASHRAQALQKYEFLKDDEGIKRLSGGEK